MKSHHIAFFVGPAHGHINPTLASASKLVARGHRVTYAVPERFGSELRDMGIDVVAYDMSLVPEGFSGDEERNRRLRGVANIINESIKTHESFMNDRPDLIVHDYMDVSGMLLSKKLPAVPSVKFFPSFAHNESFPISRGGWHSGDDWIEKNRMALNETPGLDGIGDYFFDRISKINVVFIPRFFQYEGDAFDSRFFFVGPSIAKRGFYGRWSPPMSQSRVILISLGTVLNAQIEFFRMCISALKNLDMHVVMSVGKGVDISLLEPIPSNVEVHQFISHIDILPYASACIGHGGMNSTMEALYYGVPLLLAPQDGHQDLIARRAVELGVGQLLPVPHITQDILKESLLSLLQNGELVSRVNKIGRAMRANDSTGKVVDIIEECLRGSTLVRA